jgi:hypothetical protein
VVVEWFSQSFSTNLGEAGLATVPFGGHLSGDYRSTTDSPSKSPSRSACISGAPEEFAAV